MRSLTTLALLVALCAATAAAGRALAGNAAPEGAAPAVDSAAADTAGEAGPSPLAGDTAECVYTAAPQPPTIGVDSRMFNGATFAWWLPPVTPACVSYVQYQFVEGKGKPSDGGYTKTEPEGWRYGYMTKYVESGGAKKLTLYMRSVQVSPSNVTRHSKVAKKSYTLFKG